MRIVFCCLWIGLAGTGIFMSQISLAQAVSSKPKTESVMSPGMKITVNSPAGTMTITAKDDLVRAYTWEGATRSVEMIPRGQRWYGSLGLYYPGPGDHWQEHHGITRGVLEEGQQHFKTTAEALKWLHTWQLVYRDDGLAAGWSKTLGRRQLNVSVWQVYVAGKKPVKLPGSQNGKIVVTFGLAETSPLARAVVGGDLKTVQALLNQGADPNTRNSVETPVLVVAAGRGDAAIVQALLDKGAKADARDVGGATALLKAVEQRQVAVARALLAKGAKTEAAYEKGLEAGVTPLILAALNGDGETVRTLLDGGANVKAADAMGKTALYWAATTMGTVSIAEILVNKGAEVDSRDWLGMTSLMEAALEGHVEMVKFLIAHKANVNARNDATRKMYRAAQFDGDTATQKEIEKSGRLNTLHEDGNSVLEWASISGNKEVLALLKAAGAKGQAPEPVPAATTKAAAPTFSKNAPIRYRITEIGTLGGSTSIANAINANGQVVGSGGAVFLWQKGVQSALSGIPNKMGNGASDINSQGHVVGLFGDRGSSTAFLWRNGKRERLFADGRVSGASAINDKDQIVGEMAVESKMLLFGIRHAYLWQEGRITDLGTLSGGSSWAVDINASGQIIGHSDIHGFLWENGKMQDLGSLGGKQTEANGINDSAHVVGSSQTADGQYHAFLWEKGQLYDLGSPAPGLCEAWKINNRGIVVGYWWPEGKDIDASRALVWIDRKMYDLNDLIPKGSGWVLENALGINDRGEIVGRGKHNGTEYTNTRAFLLTPVK